ncbi:alpha/beta hydrolase [Acrocarpospora phusangensis]|uniref:Alpha/beta hydrolase n=2 Tax=Acrocarpospora phusangensis TaxID=1070424 RepID=A0A919URE5_9ACTN|nr:alpha/beta hydrolase [Acrocarpospora phusangensis]
MFHGTPGGRLGPLPRDSLLYRLGIRLITYDRPGYGKSTRREGRRVADCVADVETIAAYLDIKRFAVVGRSGGGPHALACAALLPDRVSSVAAIVSLAPHDADGLDWYQDMSASNQLKYKVASTDGREVVEERLTPEAMRIAEHPWKLIDSLYAEMPLADRRVLRDGALRTVIEKSYVEAVQQQAAGWADDVMAFVQPWGFEVSTIDCPTMLWHGMDDVFSPLTHTNWLKQRIRNSVVRREPRAAHFHALDALPDLLLWLTADGPEFASPPTYATSPLMAGSHH